jgi:1-acyl-sn-glycerol-3-phosphate acyltransferase
MHSGLKYWKYSVATTFGPIIPVAFTVFVGSKLASSNPAVSFGFLIVVVAIVVISLFFRKRIIAFIFREKKTKEEKISEMKIRKPSRLIYKIFLPILRRRVFNKHNAKVVYETDIKNINGPFLVFCNHPTRQDYVYFCIAMLPHRLHVVVNRYFFHDKLLGPLLARAGAIPKKLYQSDFFAMREILKVLKDGRPIGLTPEGINSVNGESMGIIPATSKLVKHLKVPVIGIVINGAFLTRAKWRQKEPPRVSRVEITVKEMLTKEQVEQLDSDAILRVLEKGLYYDDFAWAEENKVEYKPGDLASKVDYAIFKCPRCKSEFNIKAEGDRLECAECGNGANINKYYQLEPFDDACVIPKSIGKWYDYQREVLFEETAQDGFKMRSEVVLKMLKKGKEVPVGEGKLTLTRSGLLYESVSGKEARLVIPRMQLPAVALNYNDSIELYFDEIFYLFAMKESVTAVKWAIAIEQIYKRYGASGE